MLLALDKSCLFKLELSKQSPSITVIFLKPDLTNASKQAPPTPPTPTIKIAFVQIYVKSSSLINNFKRSNIKNHHPNKNINKKRNK